MIKINEALNWNKVFDFNKIGSNDQYQLQDTIADVIIRSTKECDLDDYGMNTYGSNGEDQTIVFIGELYHPKFSKNKMDKKPLSRKEISAVESALKSKIKLPKNTDTITYKTEFDYSGTEIRFRIKKVIW